MVIVEVQFRVCADVVISVTMMNRSCVTIYIYIYIYVCVYSFNEMEIKENHI